MELPSYSNPTALQLERLREYCRILAEENRRVRLVGPYDEKALWEDHILDCINLLPLLPPSGSVLDLGSGGGLPGVVLALCRTDLDFTLVDSLSRKTLALEAIVRRLGLSVQVVCARSENLALQRREVFCCAVARAVAHCGVVAEYLSPLVAPGGTLLALKGPSWQDETDPLTGQWGRLGLSEPQAYRYALKGQERLVLQWRKEAPCPADFPRRPGRAEKRHWWR